MIHSPIVALIDCFDIILTGTSAWITSSSGSSSSNVPTIISAQTSGAEANQSTSDPPKIGQCLQTIVI